jgi:hypothetical protein
VLSQPNIKTINKSYVVVDLVFFFIAVLKGQSYEKGLSTKHMGGMPYATNMDRWPVQKWSIIPQKVRISEKFIFTI